MSSLASIIRRGTLYVEVMPEPSALPLAESLVAFANTEGGTVLLGVNDRGEIRGGLEMEDVDSVLRGALAWCRPIIHTEIERVHGGRADSSRGYLPGGGGRGRRVPRVDVLPRR